MRAWTRRTLWACCSPCGPSTGVFNGHRLADSIAADLTTAVRSIGSLAYSHRSRCRRSEACASGALMATRMRDHSGPGHGCHGARCCDSCAWQVLRAMPQHVTRSFCWSIFRSTVHRCNTSLAMAIALYIVSKSSIHGIAGLHGCDQILFFFLRSISPSPPRLVRFLALVALAPPLDAVPFRCSSATVALIFWRCTAALGRNNSSALALRYV